MAALRKGWIVNISRDDGTHEVERDQEPVITFDDGEFAFEVWFWHPRLARYFVLTKGPQDPSLIAQGVIYFTPNEIPDVLRARVSLLEKMSGARRSA